MGRIFSVRPSQWEVDNAFVVKAGLEYQRSHDGNLPLNGVWKMLQYRYDINAARFAKYHPNVAKMILESHKVKPQIPWCPLPPPLPEVCIPVVIVPPDPNPSDCPVNPSVPEPTSFVMAAFVIPVAYLYMKYKVR